MTRDGGPVPRILAFDTSAAHIAAAVVGPGLSFEVTEDMARGQAERLMGLLDALLADAGIDYDQLDAIGVGIGPGNFTGIRISVAAARGLAMALGIPAIGVSSLEVLVEGASGKADDTILASVRGPKDQAYLQVFASGRPVSAPRLVDVRELPQDLDIPKDAEVRGHLAPVLAGYLGLRAGPETVPSVGASIGRVAALKLVETGFDPAARPAPLYVRAPDAAPPKHDAPVILDA